MIERLRTLQGRYRSLDKREQSQLLASLDTDTDLQEEVRDLAAHFLGRKVSGCSFCALSALWELLALNLEKMEKKERNNTLGFALRAGTFLIDPVNHEVDKILTPHTLTDDLALYHLSFNPASRDYFTHLPQDVDARIDAYIRGLADDTANLVLDGQTRSIEALRLKRNSLKAAYDNDAKELEQRRIQIEELDARIAAAEAQQAPLAKRISQSGDAADAPDELFENTARELIAGYVADGQTVAQITEHLSGDVASGRITKSRIKQLVREVKAWGGSTE